MQSAVTHPANINKHGVLAVINTWKMRIDRLIQGLILSLACMAALAGGTPARAEASHAQPACQALPGFEDTAAASVVILGDAHGTVQSPEVFGRAACLFIQRLGTAKGMIGLELPDRFNTYFSDVGVVDLPALQRRVETDVFWNSFGDGRHSAAMLELVHGLLNLSADSQGRVLLVAVERPGIDVAGAAFFVERMRGFSADKGLVLIGNAHARMTQMAGRSSTPFAQNIASAGFSVLSLDVWTGGGEGWLCASACKPSPWLPRPLGDQTKVVVAPCHGSCPYHGYYYVPRLSISSLARPQ